MTTRNAADLTAIENKIADCEARLACAAEHQLADLNAEHEQLVAAWVKLSSHLGRLAA